MRIHLVHPGVKWSLSDVYDGLAYGLKANGVACVPTMEGCDWIIVVNPNLHTPDTLTGWQATYAPVAALCTESPYDVDLELARAAVVTGLWTNERASVATFAAVNPCSRYLPHAWHPERHGQQAPDPSVPAHDVVFVGSGFSERIEWFNRIDWEGIDLGLYGLWDAYGLEDRLVERCVKAEITPNDYAAKLYQRAKISLNLYRTKPGIRKVIPRPDVYAESLNPRAYELARCGVFHLSSGRAEVNEVFGDLVPRISGKVADATSDGRIIREWLTRPDDRAALSAALPAAVADDSWVNRSRQVLHDLEEWRRA